MSDGTTTLTRAKFKVRDIFDVALVLERHDEARQEICRFLHESAAVLLARLERMDLASREDFAAIESTWVVSLG